MKAKIINSNELQKFKTFSAGFFINTSKLTRDSVYELPNEEINRLADLLLSQPDIASFLTSEVGPFKDSKEKKIQAIVYFIDNKDKLLLEQNEKIQTAQKRHEELLTTSEKIVVPNSDLESIRLKEIEQMNDREQENEVDRER